MNTVIRDCSGVILAGGENKRMPVLKAFIEVDGEKIIERNLKVIKNLFKENFIVTNQPGMYASLDALLLGDIYHKRGPMTGIFTSLFNSTNRWVFIVACDMPFINEQLIRYMASKRDSYDAVVPELNDKPEPLFAFYSKRLLSSMEKAILTGKRGLKDFFRNKEVKYIRSGEIQAIDKRALSFINLNTPEDIKRYLYSEGIED